jgi:uncharacterized protein YecT (DUF1311 family)
MPDIIRAVGAVLLALPHLLAAHAATAQGLPDNARAIEGKLPLFAKNHCEGIRDPAEQLFCGDPELNAAGARLRSAIEERLSRVPDRGRAIAENAEWVKDRNASCGIFGREPVRTNEVEPVKACLLKVTEERTAILRDPNFDCLATNSAAGTLICSDPELAIAETELNLGIMGLIGKLQPDEARAAFAEYTRWTRDRDRKCSLVGKDNVPLDELSSSEGCLTDFMQEKTAEVAAARGDPKRVFGRNAPSPLPNADAVDLCVSQIHAANGCGDFLRISRVVEVDSQVAEKEALVTAEIEMVVLSPFSVCSNVATSCTGTCWDPTTGKPGRSQGSRDSFAVSHRLRVQKAFTIQKADGGGWRCNANALQPIAFGVAFSRR